jgi:hypothetical protein
MDKGETKVKVVIKHLSWKLPEEGGGGENIAELETAGGSFTDKISKERNGTEEY